MPYTPRPRRRNRPRAARPIERVRGVLRNESLRKPRRYGRGGECHQKQRNKESSWVWTMPGLRLARKLRLVCPRLN